MLDAGTEPDGKRSIVFEYVEGEDLRRLLSREGALGWPQAREIVTRVAEALAVAHGRGVAHRDIKPENIGTCPTDLCDAFRRHMVWK